MRISLRNTSLRALCLLPALALGACDPKLKVGEVLEEDAPADTSSTGDDATSDSSDSASSEPAPDDTTADVPDSDSSGAPDDDSGEPVASCDLWAQDCPPGQKCAAYADDGSNTWNALHCVPIDPEPLPPGSPCEVTGDLLSGIDNCDIGSMCWGVVPDGDSNPGTCVAQCTGSPDEPHCGEGEQCIISNEGVLALCLDQCDPLLQVCPGGEDLCIHDGTKFVCATDASGEEGQAFDPCEFLNVCDKGLACVPSDLAAECDSWADHCCLPFCDLSKPNECPGAGQECVSFFGEGQAPAGQENIGLCSLPG